MQTNLTSFQEKKTKLSNDLKAVAEDAEELIRATGGEVAERTRLARERLGQLVDQARDTCAQLEEQAVARVRATDQSIRENPYRSIGVAVGVGFLVGAWLKRK
ncbi:MAG: DUF883 family protein [Verrucomicrobiota bacterium]